MARTEKLFIAVSASMVNRIQMETGLVETLAVLWVILTEVDIALRQKGEKMTNKEAIKMLEEIRDATEAWYGLSEDGRDMFWLAIEALRQPEIVRCKDCKWYGRSDKRRFYRGMDCLQKRIDTIIPDKDFCSRAERREG